MILKRAYFSLIELMVVIAIIGFLAGIMVVNFSGQADVAAIKTTKATIVQVSDGLKMYRLQKRKYPSTDEGLEAMIEAGVLERFPKDAWGNDLNYQFPGSSEQPFDLWSLGGDGMDGGEKVNADIFNRPDEENL
jgi:general secretion pathway protein G